MPTSTAPVDAIPAVDQELGEVTALWVAPELAYPLRPAYGDSEALRRVQRILRAQVHRLE